MKILLAHLGGHGFGGLGFLIVAILFVTLLLSIWPQNKESETKRKSD